MSTTDEAALLILRMKDAIARGEARRARLRAERAEAAAIRAELEAAEWGEGET